MKEHTFDHGPTSGPNSGSDEPVDATRSINEDTAMSSSGSLSGSLSGSSSGSSKGLEADRETSCRLVLELLPEAVGGDLDEGTELAITRHVSSCHACGREWTSLRRAHRALASLSENSLSEGGGASRMDDAFFAELHQDIMGEVEYRAQLAKDQRVFEKASVLGALVPERSAVAASLGFMGLWSRFRAPLLHVGSLAAAVLLGILIGNQFDAGAGIPQEDMGGNTATKVRDDSERGPMREASAVHSPSVTRIHERTPDEEFRAYLDQMLRGLHLPQPVIPSPILPEHYKGAWKGPFLNAKDGKKKRSAGKRSEDF